MLHPLLEEDWKDYETRKIKSKHEKQFFVCNEVWEVKFLIDKIAQKNPGIDEALIAKGVQLCCKELRSTSPPKYFAECVLKKLS